MTFTYIIFTWMILMIIRNIYIGRQENKSKGGRRMHYNGRFFW